MIYVFGLPQIKPFLSGILCVHYGKDPTVRNWFKKKRVRTCSTYLRVLYAQNSLCIHFDSMGLCVNCIVQYSFRTICQNKSSKESKSRTCPNRMSVDLGRG